MQGALFSVMNTAPTSPATSRPAPQPPGADAAAAPPCSAACSRTVLLGLVQAMTYLSVGLIVVAELVSGVGRALVIVALTVSITVAFGSIGLFAALRTGSGEAVQSLFPVFFVFLFISAMSLPLELLRTSGSTTSPRQPGHLPARGLPLLLFEGWDTGALALGFGIAAAMLIVGMFAASSAMKTRLVRT